MKLIATIAALSCCLGLAVHAAPMNFKVYDNNGSVCLIYGVDYSGMLDFKYLNGSSGSVNANFSRVDNGSSYCANGSKTFVLTVTDASTWSSLTHTFAEPSSSNDTYKLQSLVWKYSYIDTNKSANGTNVTTIEVVQASSDAGWSIGLHAANASYLCSSQFNVTWSNKSAYNNASLVWLSYSNLAVQVADISNGTLSGNVTQCAADQGTSTPVASTSTAVPATTPTPAQTTATDVPLNGRYVLRGGEGNKTCIVLDAGIGFWVPFTNASSNQTSTAFVSMHPENSTVSGSCSNTSDVLVISFLDGWSFTAVIQKDAFGYFAVNQISLTYIPSSQYINGAVVNASAKVQNSSSALGWFNTTIGSYYLCNNALYYPIGGNVTVETKYFDLQAFADFGNSTAHVGSANECVQDTPSTPAPATDNTVPIAVGAALAGLVLIVLIAYFIGRRRSRNGYQSM